MKISTVTQLAAIVAGQGERKFTNKPSFMTGATPAWWNKHSADNRMKFITDSVAKYFEMHFPEDSKAVQKLQPLFEDAIGDMDRVRGSCAGGRKRRDDEEGAKEGDNEEEEEEETDFMEADPAQKSTRKVTGDIKKDTHKFVTAQGRFVKEEIYNKGGECEHIGLRMLTRLDRLNAYLYFNYCHQVDDTADFCSTRYYKDDGSLRPHPRQSNWYQTTFERPSKN